jgi:hypothetical protein
MPPARRSSRGRWPTASIPSSARFVLARLSLALASLAGSLLLCEVVLRMLYVAPIPLAAGYPIGIRVAGGEIRLHQLEYDTRHRYNRYAFRDGELPPDLPGTVRVLVLGDSFAEGLGVDVDRRFSSLLPGRLSTGIREPVVINAAQIATAPVDYANNLADFGIALAPDLVLVTIFAGNDFFNGAALARWQRPVRDALPPSVGASNGVLSLAYLRRALRLIRDSDALVRRLRDVDLWPLIFRRPIDESLFRTMLPMFSASEIDAAIRPMDPTLLRAFYDGLLNPSTLLEAIIDRVVRARDDGQRAYHSHSSDVRGVARVMLRLRDMVAERGGKLVVVVIPDVHEMMPAAHDAFLRRLAIRPNVRMRIAGPLRRKLVLELRRLHVPTVDPSAELAAATVPVYHVMDGHLNDAGHQVVADTIARALAP